MMEPRIETELGELPASWGVAPLGESLSEAQYGASVKGAASGGCPILRMTNQVNGRISPFNLQYADVSARELETFRVQRGDILFNRTNSFELVGRTAIFDLDGDYVFASYLIRLRTLAAVLDPFFLNVYLNADGTQRRLKSIATRAVSQSNISASRLRGFVVPVPPLAEQRKIASVVGLVQRAIEQQERLIALTTELKKALLHQLFTEGLHGEPQKQTEIGPVPQSWRVNKIGEHCLSSAFGPRFSSDLYASDGNVVTLRTTDLDDDGNIDYHDAPKARINISKFENHLLRTGDIVVSRSGTCGIAAVFEGHEMSVLPGAFLIRLRLSRGLRSQFLRYYINSPVGRPRIANIAQGAIQKNISGTALKHFEVPVPDLEEQQMIEDHVEAIDRKLWLHKRRNTALTALFRTLLHQLMTAQIRVHNLDVRELAETQ